MKKRVLTLVVAIAMMLSFTGCNKKTSNLNFNADMDSPYLISEEPVELTYFYSSSDDPDGQWRIFKKAAELTNVFARTTVSKSNSNMAQSFNLMLASGNIPDLVFVQDEMQFIKYAMDGAFVPLNEHFDDMPNFKAFLDENPTVKKNITAYDGNIYYLPFVPGGKPAAGWFVRTDWMEKLGLKEPKNAQEVYDVLNAFKTQDPNGNGKADEVPYFSGTKLEELFPLWNARKDWYVKDGIIGYGPLDEEYKTAIHNLVSWYNEGLFDQEIVTRTNNARDSMLMNNIGGMTNDWFASTSRYNDTLKDEIPGFSLLPFAPPENIVLHARPANYQYGWGIYSGTKYLDIAVKYIDFWFSEEGSNLVNFGEEGIHWEMVDGKPQFTTEFLSLDSPKVELNNYGAHMGFGYKQDFEYEKQWMNQIAIDGMAMYNDGNWYAEEIPPMYMQMSAAEIEEYNLLKTQIDTHTDEMFQKWILGSADFDSTYNEYVKELENLGISRLIELQQAAYDRYMSVK